MGAYERDESDRDSTLDAVLAYAAPAMLGAKLDELPGPRSVAGLRARYERTLADRPCTQCPCAICQSPSIAVVTFRARSPTQPRGLHKLGLNNALSHRLTRQRDMRGKRAE